MSMTDSENSKCHAIIHSAAVAAGAVGAGLAQIPLSDNVVIMPIQIGMVASLGNVFGKSLGETAIKSLISAAAGTVIGRSASQALLGWIPLLGNVINASTAFTITEAIGWAIANKFADDVEQERKKIAEEEAHRQREAEKARLEAEREKRRQLDAERNRRELERVRHLARTRIEAEIASTEAEEAHRQREAEKARLEAESAESSVRNAISQVFSTITKIFWSIVNFFLCLPGRLWHMTVYVFGGIWGAIRTFFFLLWGLVSGRAVQVLKWIALKIWGGICALVFNVFNGLIVSICTAIGVFVLIWIVDKMNLLSPEYLTLFHDLLQLVN